jgi:probable phosphoglycerate mutase
MPKKIIIIRHGETDYNKERRMQGWLDVPLNKTGREQAKITATKLLGIKFDAIYSSDLIRAHETAKIITKLHKQKVTTTHALRERDMGLFAGWAWEVEHDPAKDSLWVEFESARDRDDLDWNGHKGESMRAMSERISDFMNNLHVVHKQQTILLVTHGGTINRILEHYYIKTASDGFRMISNASILILHKESITYRLEEL